MQQIEGTDIGAYHFFQHLHPTMPVLNQAMKALTWVGDRRVLVPFAVLAAALFAWRKQNVTALIILITLGLGYALSDGLKYLIRRERPDVAFQIVERPRTPSFPSAHALNSMSLFVGVALIASRPWASRWRRAALVGGALLLALIVGFSRMYLCVHYVSDVVAGFIAGLGLALLADWADRRWSPAAVGSLPDLVLSGGPPQEPRRFLPSGPAASPDPAITSPKVQPPSPSGHRPSGTSPG
jgi:membrane-associated phospholipid phosphatase